MRRLVRLASAVLVVTGTLVVVTTAPAGAVSVATAADFADAFVDDTARSRSPPRRAASRPTGPTTTAT